MHTSIFLGYHRNHIKMLFSKSILNQEFTIFRYVNIFIIPSSLETQTQSRIHYICVQLSANILICQ